MARVIPQGPGADALPPPGDARRDDLKARMDNLQQQAEALGADMGVGPTIEVENEIAQHYDHLNPPNQDPAFRYCWVYCDPYGKVGNQPFMRKKAEGWEAVRASDPDAVGLEHARHVSGNVIVGDTILMRLPLDRWLTLERKRHARQRSVESGVTTELEEMAEKYAAHGVKIHTPANMSPEMMRRMAGRAQAQQIAGQQLDKMIRSGMVPGRPVPER